MPPYTASDIPPLIFWPPDTLYLTCVFIKCNNIAAMQGIGVEQDRERALKWYQSGLRAEAQLEGAVAEFGDAAVSNVMKQKRSKEKQAQIDRGGEA